MRNIFCALFGSLLFGFISVFVTMLGTVNFVVLLVLPQILGIIIGGIFYWLCCSKPQARVSDKMIKKVLWVHLALIFSLYFVWSKIFPSETFVDNFFVDSDFLNNSLKLATIMILAPISEEIIYRGIVFGSLLSVKQNKYIAVIAALVSSCVFTAYHLQYEHTSTLVLLFFVGMLLCSARYFSKTLWVPVVIHSFASLCAVSL
jgi:membrane protease YdiL (CAAX protease family)